MTCLLEAANLPKEVALIRAGGQQAGHSEEGDC